MDSIYYAGSIRQVANLPRLKRVLLRVGLIALGGAVVLAFPAPAFSSRLTRGTITLHATEPLPPNAAVIIDEALARVRKSPLYDPARPVDVFVCRDDWRWLLFTGLNRRAAAVARAPFSHDVMIRGADFPDNRYLQAGGQLSAAERSLSYLLAHEVTHVLVADALSLRESYRLPSWLSEGYADYVAHEGKFDRAAALRNLSGATEPTRREGQYLPYMLLVARGLQHTPRIIELLRAPPDRARLQSELLAETPSAGVSE
jgi:hypothetical protein